MRRAVFVIAAATMLLPASTPPVAARPPGPPQPFQPQESAFQIRLGAFMPAGDSGFWADTEDVFTLDASDFDDFVLGLTFVRPVSNEVEIGLNVDFFEETVRSEYRGFVDENGFAILHDTQLSLIPLTADVRFLPGGRYRIRPGGRQIVKPVFYVGAGLGLTFWKYEEQGDFLDFTFDPPEIFYDRFVDDGVAFDVHLLAGVEIPMSRRTNLLLETRFSASDDRLGGDFGDLSETNLDLGGSSIYGGLSFRF
jgi:hypothetical protein